MNCKFNAITCTSCPKYNACLLQVIYTNTLALSTMIENINNRLDTIEKQSFSIDDNVDMFSNLEDITGKLDTVIKNMEMVEDDEAEKSVEYDSIQESLKTIETKLNELIRSYNSYEYVPIIEEGE